MHNVRTSSTGKQSIHQGLDFSPEIAEPDFYFVVLV